MKIIAPLLETDRLILNDMAETDAPLVVQLRSNPDVYKFFVSPHALTIEEHLIWFSNNYIFDKNRFDWIATTKAQNIPIGIFGIKRRQEDSVEAEISYILAQEFQGKGYASEAIKRLLSFIKEEWKCKTVIAEIHINNRPSIKFVENLGFVCDSIEDKFILYKRKL